MQHPSSHCWQSAQRRACRGMLDPASVILLPVQRIQGEFGEFAETRNGATTAKGSQTPLWTLLLLRCSMAFSRVPTFWTHPPSRKRPFCARSNGNSALKQPRAHLNRKPSNDPSSWATMLVADSSRTFSTACASATTLDYQGPGAVVHRSGFLVSTSPPTLR